MKYLSGNLEISPDIQDKSVSLSNYRRKEGFRR